MKKFKSLVALLLLICLVFTLTGCKKKDGNEIEQPAQMTEVSDTGTAEKPDADQQKTEQAVGDGIEVIIDAIEENDSENGNNDDGGDVISVPDDMGIGVE